ncbi:MAG TPA: GrpB family protein, partial [Mycobacteriales bacterium]|nr:GrpB family protein [Mycobacteriales bacterium]
MSAEPIHIVDYDETWPQLFAELGSDLRRALGATAIRIDHIGSTAVPGLAAKPIIDVQVSVLEFEPLDAYRIPLAGIGLRHRENTDRTKRYFRERPGARRTHVHVRRVGSFSEQLSLLFRDYLRADAAAAREYASLKREFAARFSND